MNTKMHFHEFLREADGTVSRQLFATLSAFDLHNLCNTSTLLNTAVNDYLSNPLPAPKDIIDTPQLTVDQKQECQDRLQKARESLETRYIQDAVTHHTSQFRRLLELVGPKGSISPSAFAVAVPPLARRIGTTVISHNDVQTNVVYKDIHLMVFSSLSGTHNAFINRRPSNPTATDPLADAVEAARMFGVKTYTISPACSRHFPRLLDDPLVQFMNLHVLK